MSIYVCPRGCHMTDVPKRKCPRCGEYMKEIDQRDVPKFNQLVSEAQREAGKDTALGRHVSNQKLI